MAKQLNYSRVRRRQVFVSVVLSIEWNYLGVRGWEFLMTMHGVEQLRSEGTGGFC